jgi:hypothetical protein
LITDCVGGLHSNVGLGPFFAETLGLLDYFHANDWNSELLAGTLEAIFGGLERKGFTNILTAFVHFGITVLIAICENGCDVVKTMTSMMGNRVPECCFQARCGRGADDMLRQLTVLVQGRGCSHLKKKIAHIHEQLLLGITLPPVRFIPEALTEQVPFASTYIDYHPTDRNVWRWFLHCVDCAEQLVTGYGRSDTESLNDALALGWGKARSNSWKGSCRCPIHHQESQSWSTGASNTFSCFGGNRRHAAQGGYQAAGRKSHPEDLAIDMDDDDSSEQASRCVEMIDAATQVGDSLKPHTDANEVRSRPDPKAAE